MNDEKELSVLHYLSVMGRLKFITPVRPRESVLHHWVRRRSLALTSFQFSGPILSFVNWKVAGLVPELTSYCKKV